MGCCGHAGLFSFMDRTLRCNILIRFFPVSFGPAFLFPVLFRVEFAQSNQCINSALFLFATLQGLSEGGGMEAGRGKGGGGEGEGRGGWGRGEGGRGLAYADLLALLHAFFLAEMAVPGFLSCRCGAQQPLHQQFQVFSCYLAKVLRDEKV